MAESLFFQRCRFRLSSVFAITFAVALFLSIARIATTDVAGSNFAAEMFGLAPLLCFAASGFGRGDDVRKTIPPLAATFPILLVAAIYYSYRGGEGIGFGPTMVFIGIIWSIQYTVIASFIWWWHRRQSRMAERNRSRRSY